MESSIDSLRTNADESHDDVLNFRQLYMLPSLKVDERTEIDVSETEKLVPK